MRPTITHFTSCLALAIALAATLASCSKDDASGDRLPEGKCPMTFTAAMDGLTAEKAVTRATSGNTWAGGEQVAMQIDEVVKKYTVTDATHGTLAAASGVKPWYWQSTAETRTVSAWCPYSTSQPTQFTVQSDQSSTGYQSSDLIYAALKDITYGNQAITFKHLPVKVVANLKAGNGITATEVTNATVTIESQATTSGTIATDWSVAQTTPGSSTITPNMLTATASGYQKSVQALVVPQKSTASTRFIKVAIGSQEFYYSTTPDFAAGQQYTYNITVLKSGITVTASGATAWTGTTSDVASKVIATGFAPSDLKIGDYYYSDGTTSDGGYREYTNGSKATLPIMPVLTDAGGKTRTVLGIVYWVGDITGEDPLLKTKHSGCTHGLVVALRDAGGNSLWSSGYEDITDNWLKNQSATYGITSLKVTDKMQGYANTQALIGYNASDRATENNSNKKVLPIEAITTTYAAAHPTPASSSGWYWPSVKELKYMCWGQGNSSGTAGRDLLNTQLGKVPEASSLQSGYYWSSTEYDNYWAWGVNFSGDRVYSNGKDNRSYGVRAVAAF